MNGKSIQQEDFQCFNCQMNFICLYNKCKQGNNLFCEKCVKQQHADQKDHKWENYNIELSEWNDMIQNLRERSFNELQDNLILNTYEQLEILKSSIVSSIDNMQSKMIDYCPSLSTYAKVYSYSPDINFLNSFSLRNHLNYDINKRQVEFNDPILSQNVEFPVILTRKLLLKTKELQRNFNHLSKQFLLKIERIDQSYSLYRTQIRSHQKLEEKNIEKNRKVMEYINQEDEDKLNVRKIVNNEAEETQNILRNRRRQILPLENNVIKNLISQNNQYQFQELLNQGFNNIQFILQIEQHVGSEQQNKRNKNENQLMSAIVPFKHQYLNLIIFIKDQLEEDSLNVKRRYPYDIRGEKEERKIRILKEALINGNILNTAKKNGVSGSVIRKWRKQFAHLEEIKECNLAYEQNRCSSEKYSSVQKKKILLELKEGNPKQAVASKYKIHPTTLRKWEKKFGKELGFKEFMDVNNGDEKEEEFEDDEDFDEEVSQQSEDDGDEGDQEDGEGDQDDGEEEDDEDSEDDGEGSILEIDEVEVYIEQKDEDSNAEDGKKLMEQKVSHNSRASKQNQPDGDIDEQESHEQKSNIRSSKNLRSNKEEEIVGNGTQKRQTRSGQQVYDCFYDFQLTIT